MYPNINENYAAAVRAELRKTIVQLKQQKAVTKGSFKSGTGARGAAGMLAGLEVPFKQGVVHGETALDVIGGTTSFERMYVPTTNKMYIGLTQTGFTVEHEYFHQKDADAGNLPEGRTQLRDQAMRTYLQHHNWYAIGKGDGALAVVAAGGGGGSGTITLANDNTARGRSKGSLRLAVSAFTTAGKRVMYQSYTPSTDTLTATFYITSKASSTTAVIVVTDAGTVVAGDVIVKLGHYKRVPFGLGYHIDDTGRPYQGANTVVDTFLNSSSIDGGGSLVNPTLMDTAKGGMQTRANDANARKNRVCHLTIGNYKTLAGYGYTLREYNAEKGDANTTFGLPFVYEDEDTVFIQDADMEDAYIYLRDRQSYFEYRQAELGEVSEGVTQYVGTNTVGSTEKYQNWGEAYNMAWDGRGDDGQGDGAGAPNSSVVIENLEIPAINQVSQGLSLV